MAGPRSGIRVVEATLLQNGAFAGALPADLGAEVVKIEPPATGEPGRGVEAVYRRLGVTACFQAQNRSKRGVALDLRKPAARAVVYRLIERADGAAQLARQPDSPGAGPSLGRRSRRRRAQNWPRTSPTTGSAEGSLQIAAVGRRAT
jgi:hypothetical protein